MQRFAGNMNGEQYLGNVRTREVHDLDHEEPGCGIEAIIRAGRDRPFASLEEALAAGYSRCLTCAGGTMLSFVQRSCLYWRKRRGLRLQDEEEAVGEASLRLLRRLRKGFNRAGKLSLGTLAHEYGKWAVADIDKREKRSSESLIAEQALERVPDPRPSPDRRAEAAELLEEFWDCVERLGPIRRQRIKAYLLSGQEVTLGHLARAAGVSKSAYAQSLVAAKRDILRCLQEKKIMF